MLLDVVIFTTIECIYPVKCSLWMLPCMLLNKVISKTCKPASSSNRLQYYVILFLNSQYFFKIHVCTSISARLRRAREQNSVYLNITNSCPAHQRVEPYVKLSNRLKYGWVMRFFLNNFSTSGWILNRFSQTPSGREYASVDILYLIIGWEITSLRGYKHTDILTYIREITTKSSMQRT